MLFYRKLDSCPILVIKMPKVKFSVAANIPHIPIPKLLKYRMLNMDILTFQDYRDSSLLLLYQINLEIHIPKII